MFSHIYYKNNKYKINCNEKFNLISDLKRHVLFKCFHNELLKKNIIDTNNEKNSEQNINEKK